MASLTTLDPLLIVVRPYIGDIIAYRFYGKRTAETNIETAKSTYNNGILEITFKKKEQTKTRGKTIKVE
jgi:HSP20 family molecular chaperone IbpA